MSSDFATIQVWPDHAIPVGESGENVLVTNLSGGTVFYGDRQVTQGTAVGSLTTGQSVTLTVPGNWLRATSLSVVQLTGTSQVVDASKTAKLGDDQTVGGVNGSPVSSSLALTSQVTSFAASSLGMSLVAGLPDVPENYFAASGLTGPSQVGDGIRVSDGAMTGGQNQVSSAYVFSSVDVGKRIAVVPIAATAAGASAGADVTTAAGQIAPGTLSGWITSVSSGKAVVTSDQAGTAPLNATNTCSAQVVYFGHDCTAALNACHAANLATEGGGGTGLSGGGNVRYRAAIYCFSDEVVVGNGVNLVGAGPRSTILSCMTSTASLRFDGRGGDSIGFTIYGNFLAVKQWALGTPNGVNESVQRSYHHIESKWGGPGPGTFWRTGYWSSLLYLANAQNNTFGNVTLAYGYGSGLVGDFQCGGNKCDGTFEIEEVSGYFFQGIQSPQTQTFTATGPPSAGTWTYSFTYGGVAYTTAGIAWNAASADIATAISTATSGAIPSSAFTATGGALPGTPAVLKSFIGPLNSVSVNSAGLTGGTIATAQTNPGWVSAGNNDFSGMQLERAGYASDGRAVGGIYIGSGQYYWSGKFIAVDAVVLGRGGVVDAQYPNPNPNMAGSHFMVVLVEKQGNASSASAIFAKTQFSGSGNTVGETCFAVGDGGILIIEEGNSLNAFQVALYYSQGATVKGLQKMRMNACGGSWVNGTGTTSSVTPTLVTAVTQPFQVGDQISGGTIPGFTYVTTVTGTAGNWTLGISGTGATATTSGVALTRNTGNSISTNSVNGLAVANMAPDSPAVPPRLSSITADLPVLVDIGEIAPGGVVLSNATITALIPIATFVDGSARSNRQMPMVSCTFAGKPAIGFYRFGVWSFTYSPTIQAGGLSQAAPAAAISATYDRESGSSTGNLLTSGTLQLAKCKYAITAGTVVTNCNFATGSVAATTPTHSWMCIVDPATLNVLAVTGDNLTHVISGDAGGNAAAGTAIALTSTWTPSVTVAPYVGLCVVAAVIPSQEYTAMRNGTQSIAPVLSGNSTGQTGLTGPVTVGATMGSVVVGVSGHPYMFLT